MSAFVCNPEHFRELALFATDSNRGLDCHIVTLDDIRRAYGLASLPAWADTSKYSPAEIIAHALYLENVRSVNYRYREQSEPMPVARFGHARKITSPAHILKMLDCLEYQSCETDDYEQTPAYKLLSLIRRMAWRKVPGYDAGPWDYCAHETHTVETVTA